MSVLRNQSWCNKVDLTIPQRYQSNPTFNEAIENESYHLNSCQLFQKKICYIVYALLYFDPFLIHKGTFKRANEVKYRVYLEPELRIHEKSRFDEIRVKLRKHLLTVFWYMIIKSFVLCIIHLITCILIKRRNNDFANKDLNELKLAKVRKIGDLIGNPLSNYPETGLMAYVIFLVTIGYGLIILPNIYQNEPMDVAYLRFMLDPQREIRRIEFIIIQQLERVFIESSNYRLVMAQLNQLALLRPSTFNPTWYQIIYWFLITITLGAILASILHAVLIAFVFRFLIRSKCKSIELETNCLIWNAYTWQEILSLIDLVIGQIACITLWSAVILTMISYIACQLWLSLGIKRDLSRCLAIIRNENLRFRRFHRRRTSSELEGDIKSPHNAKFSQSARVNRTKLDKEQDTNRNWGMKIREEMVIENLLQTYIKITVGIEEMRRAARFLNQFTETLIILISSLVLSVTLIYRIGDINAIILSTWVFILAYFLANLVLFFAAFVFSLTSKQEKLAWSILAELVIYNHDRRRLWNKCNPNHNLINVMTQRWLRYIHNHNLIDKNNTVIAYGFGISYSLLIKLNFYVVSLVFLIKFIE